MTNVALHFCNKNRSKSVNISICYFIIMRTFSQQNIVNKPENMVNKPEKC